MKLVGCIDFWHARKRFGFITATTSDGDGFVVNRFFLSPRNIRQVVNTAIGVGAGVLFNVNPPKRANDLGFAVDVEIFEDEAHAAAANEKKIAADTGLEALAKESANVNS